MRCVFYFKKYKKKHTSHLQLENGKPYVYMNHFTLGEKQQPVKKNTTPLPGYFPLIHSYCVILFSIFQFNY